MPARTEDLIRIGQVSSINPPDGTCRVAFDDMQSDGTPLVSADLQIIYPRTVARQDYSMPAIGEHVLCVFLPNGYQEGFVIGSYYTSGNLPKDGNKNLFKQQFEDGTIFEYNLESHTAKIKSEYIVEVEAQNISLKSTGDINIDAAGVVNINAPQIILNQGSAGAARIGDSVSPSSITSGSSTVLIGG